LGPFELKVEKTQTTTS